MNKIANNEVRKWSIYKITSPSGRIYIGKTCNPTNRLRKYKNKGAKNQPLIYRSICKYGIENHIIEIIDSFEGTSSYCNGKEIFWIRTYMSNHSKWPKQRGLNVTDGGKSSLGWNPSSETRKKMSIARKNRKMSEDGKRRVSEFMKGHKYNVGKKHSEESIKRGLDTKKRNGYKRRTGFKHSEETKIKMSQSRRGQKRRGEALMNLLKGREKSEKPILQYDSNDFLINEYKSVKEAAQKTGIWVGTIINQCKGRVKKSRVGYTFKYKKNVV